MTHAMLTDTVNTVDEQRRRRDERRHASKVLGHEAAPPRLGAQTVRRRRTR
jgi:hypothetical protein